VVTQLPIGASTFKGLPKKIPGYAYVTGWPLLLLALMHSGALTET